MKFPEGIFKLYKIKQLDLSTFFLFLVAVFFFILIVSSLFIYIDTILWQCADQFNSGSAA